MQLADTVTLMEKLVAIICGLSPLLLIIGLAARAAVQRRKRERRLRAIEISEVDIMSGQEFEEYVARLLRHQGYGTELTKGSGDQGVDVIASRNGTRIAVQCKRFSKPVSRRAVSDAVAGKALYGCGEAMVITNCWYTKGAVELAKATDCKLVDRQVLTDWILAFQGSQVDASGLRAQAEPGSWAYGNDGAQALRAVKWVGGVFLVLGVVILVRLLFGRLWYLLGS